MVVEINWKTALVIFLDIVYKPLTIEGSKWALMGSVATILQGCNLQPNDIDILVEKPKTVHTISTLLAEFYGEKIEGRPFYKEKKWLSSKEQPVYEGLGPYGFSWVFAKLKINDFFVEVTHKLPPEDHPFRNDTLWESGPNVWPYIKEVPLKEYQIPVIPLEIQLETNYEREFEERIKQIVQLFKENGYDKDLLNKVLGEQYKQKFIESISLKKIDQKRD
ncbi:MAG: hypothetical protein ACTSQN_17950 [Candidatus Heimdallarchaeota archaeon]